MTKPLPQSLLKYKRIAPLRRELPSPEEVKRRNGRPSIKTAELVDAICERIASGRSIQSLAADDDMPEIGMIYRWKLADAAFSHMIDLAREERKETTRCKLLDLGDRVISDPHLDPNRANAAAHAWAKAEACAGPRQSKLEVTGRGGGPVEISDVTDIEMARRIAFIFESARVKQRQLSHAETIVTVPANQGE